MLLEGFGAQLAARRITARQFALLESFQARMEAAAHGSEPDRLSVIAIENSRFHKLIIEASGNRRLLALLSSIIEMPLMLGTFKRYKEQDLLRSLAHHREMLAAFEVRDGDWARAVMECHVMAARHVLARSARISSLADNGNRRSQSRGGQPRPSPANQLRD